MRKPPSNGVAATAENPTGNTAVVPSNSPVASGVDTRGSGSVVTVTVLSIGGSESIDDLKRNPTDPIATVVANAPSTAATGRLNQAPLTAERSLASPRSIVTCGVENPASGKAADMVDDSGIVAAS
jgi:hypothetical protein